MLDSGESRKEVVRPDFNRGIRIDFQGAQITSDYIYGGRYDADGTQGSPFTPQPIPVSIGSSNTDIGDAKVEWTDLGGNGGPKYRIDITLPAAFWAQLSGTNAFIWGSGICANDTAQGVFRVAPPGGGVVPIPGSVVLLGTGLAGLLALGLGRRGRSRNGAG
jgi:hypothetical protein